MRCNMILFGLQCFLLELSLLYAVHSRPACKYFLRYVKHVTVMFYWTECIKLLWTVRDIFFAADRIIKGH